MVAHCVSSSGRQERELLPVSCPKDHHVWLDSAAVHGMKCLAIAALHQRDQPTTINNPQALPPLLNLSKIDYGAQYPPNRNIYFWLA